MSKLKTEGIVVKIQQSLHSSDAQKRILIYDKARILFFESGEPGIVEPILKKMGDSPKKYFRAKIENQEVKIFEEMQNQSW